MSRPSIVRLTLSLCLPLFAATGAPADAAAAGRQPTDLAGTWDLRLVDAGASCRVMLRAQATDKGDYFLGMPAACRHAMPALEAAGRWTMPDDTHISIASPAGIQILTLTANGNGFTAQGPGGVYALTPIVLTGRATASFEAIDSAPVLQGAGFADVVPPRPEAGKSDGSKAKVELVASRHARAEAVSQDKASDLAGRYAVMRDKRDTGCMVTLDDTSRVKGGDRAQLAPGCRDQGIVIFDPSAWQLVKGELVLTARAGHKVELAKQGEGLWAKDAKDGGKPLGLKRL
jgi:hypothetical protein